MEKQELLQKYAEGWMTGNCAQILEATSPGYYFHDPEKGKITRDEFAAYFTAFAAALGCGEPFMDIKGVLVEEVGQSLVATCYWEAGTHTRVRGTGQIKVSADGVESEQVALIVA